MRKRVKRFGYDKPARPAPAKWPHDHAEKHAAGASPAKSKAPARKSTRAADRAAANSAFPGLPAGAAKAARGKVIEQRHPPKETARQAAIKRGTQVRMQARRPHTEVNLTGPGLYSGPEVRVARSAHAGGGKITVTNREIIQRQLGALLKSMAQGESPQAEARYRVNISPEIARLDAELDYLGQQLQHAAKGEKTERREELARLAARRRERYTALYAAELRAVQAQYAKFAKVPRRRNRERASKVGQSYLTDALRAQDEATIAAWRHWDGLPKPFSVASESRQDATQARARAWERVQDAVVAWAEGRGLKHERYK